MAYGERCDMTCLMVEPLDSEKGMPKNANTVENFVEFKDALLINANGCELDINRRGENFMLPLMFVAQS